MSSSFRVDATGITNCALGLSLTICCALSTIIGSRRLISLWRLPGNKPITGLSSSSKNSFRNVY